MNAMQTSAYRLTLMLGCVLVTACAGMDYQPTATSDVFTTAALPMYTGTPEKKLRPLVDRAPFDFNCPAEQMTYKQMGSSNSVGVIGCGKRATYQVVPGAGWVMNTSSESASGASAAPTPVAAPVAAPGPAAPPAH